MSSPTGKRILVVDDEIFIREIVAFDLEVAGHRVMHAESGRAAMEVLKAEPLDLVISDVRMPGGTGVELLAALKEWNPETPSFVFMTAFADISAGEALDKGAEAFLTKPLDRNLMMDAIQGPLAGRPARWAVPIDDAGLRLITASCGTGFDFASPPKVVLGSGGAFVEMHGDFPESLEVVRFLIGPELAGVGRVRWVRHEATPDRPPGIGLEFLYLTDEARPKYLEFMRRQRPKAFVPLG